MKVARSIAGMLALAALPALTGCVGLAEFRKLQYEVRQMKSGGAGAGGPQRLADVSSELETMREQISQLEGRLEVTEHQTQEALEEAKKARLAATQGAASGPAAQGASDDPTAGLSPEASASEEVKSYRAAYDAWRSDDHQQCIDRFGQFLQSFPASPYVDDASFWLADCYCKRGDLKSYETAVLRFDDVVSRFPKSDKAPEALYREGETLLKLQAKYGTGAARKAFERVTKEYPGSSRAADARQQLNLLGPLEAHGSAR